MGFMKKVKQCWSYDLTRYRQITFANRPIGYARPDIAFEMAKMSSHFENGAKELAFTRQTSTVELTNALGKLSEQLSARSLIPPLTGEMYAIRHWSGAADLGYLDRAASLAMGIRTYSVHLNAYVLQGGSMKMWIARRANNRRYFPGLLDNLVAGGQPATLGFFENLEKEAIEEAGISYDLIHRARMSSQLSYRFDGPDGLVDSVVTTFDLELPHSFQPRNLDSGVEEFYLLPIEEVAERIRDSEEFKFNSALVIMDFCLRHRILQSDLLQELEQVRSILNTPEPID
jgi:isopentenyldiphosphate isomerase